MRTVCDKSQLLSYVCALYAMCAHLQNLRRIAIALMRFNFASLSHLGGNTPEFGLDSGMARARPSAPTAPTSLSSPTPRRLLALSHTRLAAESKKRDSNLLERLERAGFRAWSGEDGTGLTPLLLRTGKV